MTEDNILRPEFVQHAREEDADGDTSTDKPSAEIRSIFSASGRYRSDLLTHDILDDISERVAAVQARYNNSIKVRLEFTQQNTNNGEAFAALWKNEVRFFLDANDNDTNPQRAFLILVAEHKRRDNAEGVVFTHYTLKNDDPDGWSIAYGRMHTLGEDYFEDIAPKLQRKLQAALSSEYRKADEAGQRYDAWKPIM